MPLHVPARLRLDSPLIPFVDGGAFVHTGLLFLHRSRALGYLSFLAHLSRVL